MWRNIHGTVINGLFIVYTRVTKVHVLQWKVLWKIMLFMVSQKPIRPDRYVNHASVISS